MTGRRRELLVLAGLLLGLGVALGAAWFAVAPTPEYVMRSDGLFFASTQPGEFIAMDGWFAVLSLAAGLVAGVHVARRGRPSVPALVLLAAGGLSGAALGMVLGGELGPPEARPPFMPVVGDVVHGPLELNALGVLAVWPITSLVVVLLALAWGSADDGADDGADDVSEPADDDAGGEDEGASVPADGQRGEVDRRQ